MRIILIYFFIFFTVISFFSCSNQINGPVESDLNESSYANTSPPIENFYPIPSKSQLDWENSKITMFIHFGINTFTDKEWGDGTDDPKLFNPTNLDVNQWTEIAKEIGFKYLILTVKHHDGFCLWPSAYTDYSVKNSSYKNGKGDIVKEFADACQENGLKFCFYLSPWDRHEPTYGTDKYNLYYQNQLIELLNNYGDVGEVWLDNANGEGPNGKQQDYNWNLFYSTIKHYQPNALISNMGPDIRWVGNESGLGNDTEWCPQPATQILFGFSNVKVWYPSEADISIRPGWFYHEKENYQIKDANQLVDIYFNTVGKNSNLLLNVPPDKEGLISNLDIAALRNWKNKLDEIFANDLFLNKKIVASNTRGVGNDYAPQNCLDNNINTFWVTDDTVRKANLIISLNTKVNINIFKIEEAIEYGQRICSFSLWANVNNNWEKIYSGATVGRTRLIKISPIFTDKIKLSIDSSYAAPTIRTFSAYYYPGL